MVKLLFLIKNNHNFPFFVSLGSVFFDWVPFGHSQNFPLVQKLGRKWLSQYKLWTGAVVPVPVIGNIEYYDR